MERSRRQADRIAANVFLALVAIFFVILASPLWLMVRGAFTSPRDVKIANPALAVRDARALIDDRAKHPEKYGAYTGPESLPASLRIADLRYAKVHDDHIDLVIARNPDWAIGARIWSARHRPHVDEVTKYPNVHFFRYTHELPESPHNIP